MPTTQKVSERKLKDFISAEQAVGKTVAKIVFTPRGKEYHGSSQIDAASVAVHFTDGTVAVFAFWNDWSGCYYAGETAEGHGVNIEDEGELADADASADELELWKE